ncbi:MAG: hypothetical protein QOF60_903 [Actinomycetota bacterium]|jgi:hypothetical protein|nr:hypothetical protein [Actinomycetota bacterium]
MALAVFFLLAGILASEVAMIGIQPAGLVGALLFMASAGTLAIRWSHQRTLKSGHRLPIN